MREIKFRAWDKTGKNWSGWREVTLGRGIHYFHPAKLEDLEVMQYTGLKDKNGTEIYEGDILDFGDYSIAKYGRCLHTVYWDDDSAGFETKEIGFQKHSGFPLDPFSEVIGNIYDNPEQLKLEV